MAVIWAGGASIWLFFVAQMPLCYPALQTQLKSPEYDSSHVAISALWPLF